MKIYIEFLIPLILLLMLASWRVWLIITKNRLIKKYKPDNDKAKKGDSRGNIGRTEEPEPRVTEQVLDSTGLNQSEGQRLFDVPTANEIRQDSRSIGNTKPSPKGILGRLRRNRRKR